FYSAVLFITVPASGQIDTTRHGWPVTPFFQTHPITGVFGEFRNTLSSDHFHNGADIPKPDGSPVYSVYDGIVTSIGTVASSGTSAFVRVRYNVSGFSKSDAYVHIGPNPLLNVGDSVYAYQTVLGNILSGLGHVHFTHGNVGVEMNGIRPVGGLTPYIDIYPPDIVSVRFFIDETETEFVDRRVSGPVDIRVHVRETNAADPSNVTSSTSNNGTYIVGYKILSADTSTVLDEPPSGGVRYRFDSKPNNSYVHRVFSTGSDLSTHIYTITNGNGADYINNTAIVNLNAWNTGGLTPGDYVVMIFAEDTRALAETVYVPVRVEEGDVVPPAVPVLRSVINDSTARITVAWNANPDADLLGYRMYFSFDGVTWNLKDNESILRPGDSIRSYPNVTSRNAIYFRLAALDSAAPPNVSGFSDVYGVRLNNTSPVRTLIVDGFDRTEPAGSYHDPSHPFAMTWGTSLPLDFSTCSNDAVIAGEVVLGDYDIVLWLLGDESSADETFSVAEQDRVKAFLQQGGKLLVSGSEIAYDLDRSAGPTQADRDFLHGFLKTRYEGDDADVFTVTGDPGTVFSDVDLRYGIVSEGSPYEEDWPDYLIPEGGSTVVLHYGDATSPFFAGLGYKGLFPGGGSPGGVVVTGFPFETVTTKAGRDTLMKRVYQFFDQLTSVGNTASHETPPFRFALDQNYPNPFNPSTTIRFSVAAERRVTLTVYDVLGREVATLIDEEMKPGEYAVQWDAVNAASGVYWYRMLAGDVSFVRPMMVLK
ncbi:MAG: T9SS type A sorting domain-containing protein, partial [Ignavibacteria bacterium]|nr:T9SS type A sorting domain-containing protein [Ignavibacteria bacterium]